MFDYQPGTATFVHLATAAQILGFLVTKQIVLRVLVLIGSGLFVTYYYLHLGTPQWDAVVGSSLIALANLIGLVFLIYSRMPIGMSPQDRLLFDALGGLEPGQFRRLMKIGRLRRARGPVELTREGAAPPHLCFVMEGRPLILKDGHAFRIQDNCFVGEVAFKLGGPASATVTLPEGGSYVSWPREALEPLLGRSPILAQAFDALISRDMASKVAASAPIGSQSVAPPSGRVPSMQQTV